MYAARRELLIDTFRYLNTSQLARAAQVSRTWHAVSKHAHLWRHLSFSVAKVSRHSDAKLIRKHFENLGARCGNTVESVDFANLDCPSGALLIRGLLASASCLKHLRSDPETDSQVAELAGRCPQLETLELHTGHVMLSILLVVDAACVAKPKHFVLESFSLCETLAFTVELPNEKATLFDHATTLDFRVRGYYAHKKKGWIMPLDTFARILRNPAVEQLTVHGLWKDGVIAISEVRAPSLTHLDLRWSDGLGPNLRELDAPSLRELAIDGRLLHLFTTPSLSLLRSLTLRIVGLEDDLDGHPELGAIDRVRHHQGALKLDVGRSFTAEVLMLLSEAFFGQG